MLPWNAEAVSSSGSMSATNYRAPISYVSDVASYKTKWYFNIWRTDWKRKHSGTSLPLEHWLIFSAAQEPIFEKCPLLSRKASVQLPSQTAAQACCSVHVKAQTQYLCTPTDQTRQKDGSTFRPTKPELTHKPAQETLHTQHKACHDCVLCVQSDQIAIVLPHHHFPNCFLETKLRGEASLQAV